VPYLTFNRVLVLIALILFVLAALSVSLGSLNLIALGLAFWAASQLVP
jgi:hypothetical protein